MKQALTNTKCVKFVYCDDLKVKNDKTIVDNNIIFRLTVVNNGRQVWLLAVFWTRAGYEPISTVITSQPSSLEHDKSDGIDTEGKRYDATDACLRDASGTCTCYHLRERRTGPHRDVKTIRIVVLLHAYPLAIVKAGRMIA